MDDIHFYIEQIIDREAEKQGLTDDQETILMDWLYNSMEPRDFTVVLRIEAGTVSIVSSPPTPLSLLEAPFL